MLTAFSRENLRLILVLVLFTVYIGNMQVEQQFVTVSSGEGDEKLHLPTNPEGHLEMSLVKEYFPGAVGLTYVVENEKRVVEKVEHDFKPPCKTGWGITEYCVFYCNNTTNGQSQNNDRIQKLMAQIREQRQTRQSNNSVIKSSLSKAKKDTVGRLTKLHVGWLHKGGKRYTQMKRPHGGIRTLDVKDTDIITVPTLTKLIIKVFFEGEMKQMLYSEDDLTFNLGKYDGTIIEKFENKEGNACDLFQYMKCNGLLPSKFNFYLLTSLKVEEKIMIAETIDELEEKPGGTDKVDLKLSVPVPSYLEGQKEFDIQYQLMNRSAYTNQTYVSTLFDEQSCIDMILLQPGITWCSDYNILDFGFQICNIGHQNQCFLNIIYNNETHLCDYEFPSVQPPIIPHSILHDVGELVGIYEKKLGICVIPSFKSECRPNFKWYHNGKLLFEKYFMYFINISKDGEYTCEIECKNGKMIATPICVDFFTTLYSSTSESISENSNSEDLLSTNSDQTESMASNFESQDKLLTTISVAKNCGNHGDMTLENLTLPIISKEDLVFSKNVLGSGAQGKVTAGTWLGTEVAIKSIRVGSKGTQKRLAMREIDIHSQIRHPNIVQIMGCSDSTNTIHVVMELVKGESLYNILFDDEIKKIYVLDAEKKKTIALQICQAVNYLHKQKEPIVHRDIKPSNILVSATLVTKICDLGLSKLYNLTNITKTVGGFAKGTPMYMAPELLLHYQRATTKSDVWSLACTIIELYTECDVWELDGDEDFESILKKKMQKCELPQLKEVPIPLRHIISNCLSYDPKKRPNVELVMDALKSFRIN